MKDCQHCKTAIHEQATKCPNCRSWQSNSGTLSSSSEKALIASFFFVLLFVIGFASVSYANKHVRAAFDEETPRIIKWQVLEEYRVSTGRNSTLTSLSNLNLLNIFQAKSLAKRISDEIKKSGIDNLEACIFTRGSQCGSLSAVYQNNMLKIKKPDGLTELAEDYGSVALKKSLRGNISRVGNGSSFWTIHFS